MTSFLPTEELLSGDALKFRPSVVFAAIDALQQGASVAQIVRGIQDLSTGTTYQIPLDASELWWAVGDPAQQAWFQTQRDEIGRFAFQVGPQWPDRPELAVLRGWLLGETDHAPDWGAVERLWATWTIPTPGAGASPRRTHQRASRHQGAWRTTAASQPIGPVVYQLAFGRGTARKIGQEDAAWLVNRMVLEGTPSDREHWLRLLVSAGFPFPMSRLPDWIRVARPDDEHPLLTHFVDTPEYPNILRGLFLFHPGRWGPYVVSRGLALTTDDLVELTQRKVAPRDMVLAIQAAPAGREHPAVIAYLERSRAPHLARYAAATKGLSPARRRHLLLRGDRIAGLAALLRMSRDEIVGLAPSATVDPVVAVEVLARTQDLPRSLHPTKDAWLTKALEAHDPSLRQFATVLASVPDPQAGQEGA